MNTCGIIAINGRMLKIISAQKTLTAKINALPWFNEVEVTEFECIVPLEIRLPLSTLMGIFPEI